MFATQVLHITTTKYPFYFAESFQGSEYQLSLYSLSLYTQFSLSLLSLALSLSLDAFLEAGFLNL